MGTELELKLHLEDEMQLETVLAWPALASLRRGKVQIYNMKTTYYDTPTGDFSARHWTVRRRWENDRSVICVKTPRPSGNSLERGEWEAEAQTVQEALPALLAQGAPQALEALSRKGLAELCGARFVRRALRLVFEDGTELELAADMGELFRGDVVQPFFEAELERKQGSEQTLLLFGRRMMDELGLRIEPLSKFARARSLA